MRDRGVIKRIHPDLVEEIERLRHNIQKGGSECTFVEASRLVNPQRVRVVREDKKRKQRFVDFGIV